jgi:hypothetical protein
MFFQIFLPAAKILCLAAPSPRPRGTKAAKPKLLSFFRSPHSALRIAAYSEF